MQQKFKFPTGEIFLPDSDNLESMQRLEDMMHKNTAMKKKATMLQTMIAMLQKSTTSFQCQRKGKKH